VTVTIRPATLEDIEYILHANGVVDAQSEYQAETHLSPDRLTCDVFCDKPLAYINIAETAEGKAGMIFYSFCYYASEGQGIWVTNIYSGIEHRHKSVARALMDDLKAKYPNVCGIYGAISQHNKVARHFASHLGYESYDEFVMYGSSNTWRKR
jgi:hypothetical protein